MTFSKYIAVVLVSLFSIQFAAVVAVASEFDKPLMDLANNQIRSWLNDDIVIRAIKAQNADNDNLSQDEINALDKKWRLETDSREQPLILEILGNALSKFLIGKRDASQGLYTEIFVMDNKGLNVGQSDVTSDYWQGDEAKWQQTYLKGAGAIHISDVEFDESTQTFQSQLSITIDDSGTVIGAITIGINVEFIEE